MKLKVSIAVIAIVGGVAFMAVSSIRKDSTNRYPLDSFEQELKSNPDKVVNKNLIVMGNVKENTIVKKGIEADFEIELKGADMKVHHTGKNLLPDGFVDGAPITIEGKYDPEKNTFMSDTVTAKCASKYVPGQKKG